jgi:hypothetical protein
MVGVLEGGLRQWRGVVLILCILTQWVSPSSLHSAENARVTLPAGVLETILKQMTPYPLGPVKGLQGQLYLRHIENLKLDGNAVSADVRLTGKDLRYTVAIGNNGIVLDVGNVTMPLHVNLGLRLDRKAQKLLLIPSLRPGSRSSGEAETLKPLMDLLAQESYSLDLDTLLSQTVEAPANSLHFNVEVVDLFTAKNKLFIVFMPRIRPIS